ncbi:MAG: class I SAM-dependent methyltransferase [Promethearchaeota archaeon]
MKEFKKISPTAVGVACMRSQYTNMPYTKDIFKRIDHVKQIPFYLRVPSPFNRIARFFSRSLEPVAGLEMRYLSINEILNELDETWNIVEIAAGLSPRSLEWSDRQCLYVETDLPDMLETKKRIYKDIVENKKIKPLQKHVFVSLNAVDKDEWDRLGKTYFSNNRAKIAVINEGLLGYLSAEEKCNLRDNLRYFFRTYASEGLWITPDFSITAIPKYSRIAKHVTKGIQTHTERKFHRFNNRDEAINFLKEGDFDVIFPPNNEILTKLTCIPKMHLKKDRIQELLPIHQVCVAHFTK